MAEKEAGVVFTYFDKINVAGIKTTKELRTGDKIRIKGATTDFEQKIDSIQVEGKTVDVVGDGVKIGIKVSDKVRKGDKVFLINE